MKWEYTVRSTDTHVYFLNELGKEGWELIAANDGILFFKRPVQESISEWASEYGIAIERTVARLRAE